MADSPRIEDLRRRVQSDPASIAFAALAEEYRRVGRFDEAIDTCMVGLQRHPSYFSARVTLGRTLLEVGRHKEAQEELEHVLKLAPENLAAIRGLAEIHHRRSEDGSDEDQGHYHAAMDTARREAAADQAAADLRIPASLPADLPLNHPTPGAFPATDIRLKPELPFIPTPPVAVGAGETTSRGADALPGLEAFLSAILRAKAGRRPAAR